MENQEEVAPVHAKCPSYLKESCGLLCETRTNFRLLFRSRYHKFPLPSQRQIPRSVPPPAPAPGRSSPSSRISHTSMRTREAPAAKGSLQSLRRLFLSFPFGIRVSTDGMDDTDSGWRSLLSGFFRVRFHSFTVSYVIFQYAFLLYLFSRIFSTEKWPAGSYCGISHSCTRAGIFRPENAA